MTFDEFESEEAKILDHTEFDEYKGTYLGIHEELRPEGPEKAEISDDLVFEMELVRQLALTIDYILELVQKYCAKLCQDKEVLADIRRAVESSTELRSKKELIEAFLERVDPHSNVESEWQEHVADQKEKDLQLIVEEEGLKEEETRRLMENALHTGSLVLSGTWLGRLLAKPLSRFGNTRAETKARVEQRLYRYFEVYQDV